MGTREEPTVARMILAVVVGSAAGGLVTVALGLSWSEGARLAAGLAVITGFSCAWELHRRTTPEPRIRTGLVFALGSALAYFAVQLAFGERLVVAALATVVFIGIAAAFLAWDHRPIARARRAG